MTTTGLEAVDLTSGYTKVDAIRSVSIRVEPGEIVAVVGANGAGKTALMLALSGLARNDGRVLLDGEDVSALSPHRRAKRGIVLVPEGRRIFAGMSVEHNLMCGSLAASSRSTRKANLQRVFELFPILAKRRHQAGDTMSGGEQQMLAIGRAMMSEPRVLMLDEPSWGLAPRVVDEVLDKVRALSSANMAVVLVEQRVDRALHVADRAYVLENGRVTIEGSAAELRGDPRIQEAYLAVSAPTKETA